MRYFVSENLKGNGFAKTPILGFLVEFISLGCHRVLTVWLLGKLRESEQNEKLGFMVSCLVLLKRIEEKKKKHELLSETRFVGFFPWLLNHGM
jgi:hypothetical protein